MSVTTFTTVNGMILSQAKDGIVSHFVPDPLGSVVMVRDTSGNTVYEAEYDPYGNVQSETGTNPSSLGYVGTLGYIKDSPTSMYVRARYLLNNLGRWLTKDPLWPSEPGYVYAEADPSRNVDPSGNTCQTPPYPTSECNEKRATLKGGCIAVLCSLLAANELVEWFRGIPAGEAIIDLITHLGSAGPGPLASASDCCRDARDAGKGLPIGPGGIDPPNIIGRYCSTFYNEMGKAHYCATVSRTFRGCQACCNSMGYDPPTRGACLRKCDDRDNMEIIFPKWG